MCGMRDAHSYDAAQFEILPADAWHHAPKNYSTTHKKELYVCASHVQHSLRFGEMHRNFSLYSSLALAGSFFLFIFNASDSPSLSCVRVCVVVMQKFKICICRLFHSFHSLTISIILRFWWKKAGKKHTQKSRGWWKKSIKLHRNDRDVCGSFLEIWSWKALQFCISSTANALFCIPSHSTPRRHHHHPTAQQSSGNVIINVSTLSRLSKNFFNFHKMKLFLFAFFN